MLNRAVAGEYINMENLKTNLYETIFKKIPEENLKGGLTQRFDALDEILEQVRLAVGLVARLRGAGGCPWDREQNHLTLRQYLIEESYEVLDILDTYQSHKNPKDLAKNTPHTEEVPSDGQFTDGNRVLFKEELGDLLLQVVLHAQLCWERGDFHLGDVAEFMARKLVNRHPHVFGDTTVAGSDQVLVNWEAIKKKEGRKGLLSGLPKNLPSLQKAARIGEKANRLGFDWKDPKGPWLKVEEELLELKEAIAGGKKEDIEHELGDIFFSLCNLSRWLKIQPEDAHRKAIQRFEDRFKYVEEYFESRQKNILEASEEDLDRAWNWAKSQLANLKSTGQ